MGAGRPLARSGDPLARGRAQADARTLGPVVQAIRLRLRERAALFQRPDIRGYLTRQWAFASAECAEELAEMTGVAEGFGLAPGDVFGFLHLVHVADLAGPPAPAAAETGKQQGGAQGCREVI